MENNESARRYSFLESINDKLRVLFPNGINDAEEKRAEVLEYAACETLGLSGIRDLTAARKLPLADLEKLWSAIDRIVDAH
jgi:hypothetical protein